MGETLTPTLTAGSNMLSQGFEQPEVDILTGTITGSPFCSGSAINIPFTAAGYVDPSNIYTAQLSDASGSFTSPVTLGSLTSTVISGTISGTLPSVSTTGNYQVRVAGSAPSYPGKTSTTTIIINPLPTFTASGTNVICHDSSNGQITITATSGASPYTYSLTGSGPFPYSVSPITPLAPNTYSVLIQDNNGCIAPAPVSVTVTQPAVLAAGISGGTSPVCYNSAPGTYTATGTGASGTYTYQWYNGSAAVNGETASTYAPGNLTSSNSYYCAITSSTCGTANTAIRSVTVNVLTSAAASNTGPYVAGQSVMLSASSGGATGYQWSGPLSYSGSGQTDVIDTATVGMTGVYTVTATTALGCTATATTSVVVTTTAAYTWTGTNGTSWTDPGNWTPTAPIGGPNDCAVDVTIPNTIIAPIISTAVQVGNVQISASARLTLNSANMNVCRSWTGGTGIAAIIGGSGIVVLNGTQTQTISGYTQMQELMTANSAGISMQSGSAIDLYTSLDLTIGNFTATSGTLTFKSNTVDSVAIIDNFEPGYTGTLSGNITAERYYATSLTFNQHYMGSPVNTPSLAQFGASGTPGYIQDQNCSELEVNYSSPYGTVFSLDETHGAQCGMQQWKVLTTGSAQNGVGYSVVKSDSGKVVLNGTANLNESYSLPGLTNSGWTNTTLQGHTESSGWQLVSNPYLASLNLNAVPTGFDNQIQIWNANGLYAGSYQPGLMGYSANVAPFQAFMVHKTNAGGSATFTMSSLDLVRTPHTFFAQNANQLNIVAANVANGMLDQTTVAFNPDATDTFDMQLDAAKFPGSLGRHTLYTVNNNKWMAINVLQDEATTSTVPMGFEPGKNGTYQLTFNGLNTFDPTSYIFLEDKALNVMYNVRNGDYTFTTDSADNWNRFVLHFTPPAVITTADASCNEAGTISIQQPGTANWNYTLTGSSNAIITSGTLNQSQQVTVGVAAGTYTLTLIDTNSYTVTKTITVNGPEMITAGFQESSSTVQTGQNVILTSTTTGASTYQWNFGNGTVATGTTTSVSYTQAGVYEVSLSVTSPSGCSSTKTENITVNTSATGLNNISGANSLKIWSHDNKVYVDFTATQLSDATVIIYDILGQEISNDKVVNNVVYQKEINNIEAAYMIVMVKNDNEIITKKVFITNIK
jgi:hypothetical protein